MERFIQLFADFLSLVYHCFDRIVIQGYQANHCGSCHLVNGGGMRIGPPLNGLAKRQSRSWVENHFADPRKLVPGSIMPPYKLHARDMANLTSYLFALPD